MHSNSSSPIYCLDSNILIFSHQFDSADTLWDWMDALGKAGRVRIPEAVFDEFTNKARRPWLEARPYLICGWTEEQELCLAKIAADLGLSFYDAKTESIDADQPLVALAMSINEGFHQSYASGPAVVVTTERPKRNTEPRWHIPDACDHYGIKCVNLVEFLVMEGIIQPPPAPA